jgi:hypothetical protein
VYNVHTFKGNNINPISLIRAGDTDSVEPPMAIDLQKTTTLIEIYQLLSTKRAFPVVPLIWCRSDNNAENNFFSSNMSYEV